ncbi:MAG: RecQ family zinc-binding domain-containing protein, partial [Alistipes sp.]|nr:RecQ family zinc-binding domain-containing protein [Alistipes sp.]
ERELATISGYTVEHVKELLKRMWQMRIIRYIPANSSPIIFMDEERLPIQDLYISPETYLHRKRLVEERFDNMLAYLNNEEECRSVVMQRYFGDIEAKPCGICDCCLAARRKAKSTTPDLRHRILEMLREKPLSPRELSREIKHDPSDVAQEIEKLREEQKISTTTEGKLIII